MSQSVGFWIALSLVALAGLGFRWLWISRRARSPGRIKRLLVLLAALAFLAVAASGFHMLWLERRDRPATRDDLRILERANEILNDELAWNRNDDRACDDDETRTNWSLFCALEKSCTEVLGEYDHRRVALQEVRFAVEEASRGRQFEHRLMDFNNLPETRFEDIKRVLRVATQRVAGRLKEPH